MYNKLMRSCPKCGSKEWDEFVNPFETITPLGTRRFVPINGLLSRPNKRRLSLNKVTYRCKKCGYERSDNRLY